MRRVVVKNSFGNTNETEHGVVGVASLYDE